MKNRKKMIVTAAAFASMALFAGCAAASAVSAEEAKELARQAAGAPDAVVVQLESDRDDGVYELEVIVDGAVYEYEVDSTTGQLREVEREDDVPAMLTAETQPAETVPAATRPGTITLEEAKTIAYAHAGISEADAYDRSYEQDDGMYEIDFEYDGWDYEYDVSFEGVILKSEKERDDDHHETNHEAHREPAATESTAAQNTKAERISAEEALSIAMGHAGISEARDRDAEWDDGCWEVSFESGGYEYDYDISVDGTVLRWEKDRED